ncbi:FkbM family methyltransferase [Aequorivita soesokkakensis]|uniref:FkbM family methyltransferase n=1 Tax=Aequorivita soesokkakensis TaxID=1385699 RepID=A0A1A9LD69_9FLAO|nr:FkbM family methyltransferase [Aequorivita soesokkakensis]OAD91220.1 FkbM family methyltransferase [Aequorivita soesokkakensis]
MSFKSSLKNIVSVLIKPIATKAGYVKKSGSKAPSFEKDKLLENFFSNIKTMGFTPKHIVDVGANHGTWTREAIKYFPTAQFSLIEPQNWLQPSFQDLLDNNPKIKYYPMGVGSEVGSFKFTIVDRDDSCSFRFTEEEAKARGFEQKEIAVSTINELFKDAQPAPDLIKIDAEGLDLRVLEGASNFFGTTEILMVEAGVGNKNIENNALNVIAFMDKKGYSLFEITEMNRPFKPKMLWLLELVFVKRGGILDKFEVI